VPAGAGRLCQRGGGGDRGREPRPAPWQPRPAAV